MQNMIENNFSAFNNNFQFWKLIPTTSANIAEDCIASSWDSIEIGKRSKVAKVFPEFRKGF